jgi:hypothetical protein
MNKVFKISLGITALVLVLAGSQAAKADIVFTLGNNPQPNEENILLNNGTSGSTVSGVTNTSGVAVNFTSATQTLTEPSNGQARIEAVNDSGHQVAVTDISAITLASGDTYHDLIFNSSIGGTIGTSGGTETVTVTDNLGMTSSFSFKLGNGSNFLTIVATNGQSIASTAISYPTGFTDLRQIRISLAAVPEPSSVVLAGTSLVGLLLTGAWRRRSRSHRAA